MSNEIKRTKQIPPIRVTENEKARIEEKATKNDMTITEYVRFVALNAEIKVIVKKI